LGNRASHFESQRTAGEAAVARLRRQIDETTQLHATCQQEWERLVATEQEREHACRQQAEALNAAQRELAQSRRLIARRQEDAAQLSGRRRGVAERATVLAELEHRREGVLPGVRQLLETAASDSAAPEYAEVRGIVADLIRADVQLAPLVDAALGEAAQYVVLDGPRLLEVVSSGRLTLAGRVGLVTLGGWPRRFEFRPVQWEGRPGVLGRADRMVQFEPPYADLVEFLLGRTYFVESLREALTYHRLAPGRARFVTLAGEVCERDGRVMAGPPPTATALVSRRSELETLRCELAALDTQVEAAQLEVRDLGQNIARQEEAARRIAENQAELQERLTDARVRQRAMQDRVGQYQTQIAASAAELAAATEQQARAGGELQAVRQELLEVERDVRDLEYQMTHARGELEQLERVRHDALQEVTRAQVESATTEQGLALLRAQQAQLRDSQQERERALAEAQAGYARCRERTELSVRTILESTSALALAYLEKEALEREISASLQQRRRCQERRADTSDRLAQVRKRARRHEEQLHRSEIEAEQVRQQRAALAERIRDDYGVEIGLLESQASEAPDTGREQIEDEIASLRRKINNIGAVNLESLAELDELESRFATLAGQYQDLSQAKAALERIIQKINADSRRLFVETLEAIRANFQSIYRKAFGGGRADIVLEEGADVLECGVEILATPPGKPTFNNSLLSGGEKALTAVALLLAIFQFRPSPFCVLDEVDAPFDEANIDRFVDVLKEFLGWTKFVIVTHSKKTMTAATTLYGVTMQESGVSKRVSVRFEDVSDNGEISREALERDSAAASDDAA
jgi:chromosome segregation protein